MFLFFVENALDALYEGIAWACLPLFVAFRSTGA